jgi:hypothetical protein
MCNKFLVNQRLKPSNATGLSGLAAIELTDVIGGRHAGPGAVADGDRNLQQPTGAVAGGKNPGRLVS